MSHEVESRVSVALAERDWRLIKDTVLKECKGWGGDWIRWAEEIGSVIESAIVASYRPEQVVTANLCPECGCELIERFYPPANWMERECPICGHTSHRELSGWEREHYGDPLAGLEEWQLNDIDDLW